MHEAGNITAEHGRAHEGTLDGFLKGDQGDSLDGELLPWMHQPDGDGFSPAARGLIRLSQHLSTAHGFKGVLGTSTRRVPHGSHGVGLAGIDSDIGSQFLCQGEFGRARVHSNNGRGPGEPCSHQGTQTHTAQAKDNNGLTWLHLGRVDDGSYPREEGTAKEGGLVQRDRLVDFNERLLSGHRILGEGRDAQVVQDGLATGLMEAYTSIEECAGVVGLRPVDTQGRSANGTVQAVATGGYEGEYHMIVRLDFTHAWSHLTYDTAGIVAKDHGHQARNR